MSRRCVSSQIPKATGSTEFERFDNFIKVLVTKKKPDASKPAPTKKSQPRRRPRP